MSTSAPRGGPPPGGGSSNAGADDLFGDDAGVDDDDLGPAALGAAAPVGAHHRLAPVPGDRPRLDAHVVAQLPALSRAQAQRLIDAGHVVVDGAVIARAGQRLHAGALVEVTVPAPAPLDLVAEDLPLTVVYEDADVIAVDKAAGMVVHPAPGHPTGTLVHALLHHCRDLSGIGGTLRPGIVHRLDKDTSGVLIASKHDAAHAALVASFQAKARMVRAYLALAAPAPTWTQTSWRTLHGRHPVDRKRFSSKVSTGKPAVTHAEVVERFGADAALLRLRLETGRTHQIRVHAADHGFALIADPVYGARPRTPRVAAAAAAIGRQALHAELLELDHPMTGVRLRLEARPPADFAAALAVLRGGV